MPDRPAISGRPPATAAGERSGDDGGPHGGVRAVWAVAKRVLTGRPVRWGFGATAVAIGGYAVAREWTDVRAALASIGALMVAAALVSVLIAMFAAMQVWRMLLAALGSPLPIRVAARIMFVGQLGKYVPGSVWPVLAQMELGNAHRVPRHHSASASVLTMSCPCSAGCSPRWSRCLSSRDRRPTCGPSWPLLACSPACTRRCSIPSWGDCSGLPGVPRSSSR